MDSEGVDVASLRDEELREMLQDYGVDVGPILDSTRRVYQRKLLALLNQPPSFPPPEYEEYEEDEPEDEDPEIIFPRKEVHPKSRFEARKRVIAEQPTKVEQSSTTDSRGDYTERPASAAVSSRGMPQRTEVEPPEAQPEKKGGMSIWIQLGIFIVVALLIFLVIQNMEPAREDPLKHLDQV